MVSKVIQDNPGPSSDYLSGKEKALGFLVGQVMKLSKGKANPQIINKLLVEEMKKDM
jgi:aspartyl-tRNA(Asn)/glutamyl-tRNA(Gln) amidotransferase subunit B